MSSQKDGAALAELGRWWEAQGFLAGGCRGSALDMRVQQPLQASRWTPRRDLMGEAHKVQKPRRGQRGGKGSGRLQETAHCHKNLEQLVSCQLWPSPTRLRGMALSSHPYLKAK